MHQIELTDGTILQLLKYKSFLYSGEKYTVFLDPSCTHAEDDLPLFLLKNEPDNRYSLPEEALCQKLLPYLADLSAGGSHYFGQAEESLDIQELDAED